MTQAGTWLCRSCWKTNRPGDRRCYWCKAPRDADEAMIEASRAAYAASTATARARAGRVPIIVSLVPSIVFRVESWLAWISVAILVVFLPLIGLSSRTPAWVTFWYAGFTIYAIANAMLLRWASREMLRSNPWAFAAALLVSLGTIAIILVGLNELGIGRRPDWIDYITLVAFGLSAVLALVGLLYSLRDVERPG